MDRRTLLTAGTAGLFLEPAAADAHPSGADLVGSWFGTVTSTDPPLGAFNDLLTFHEDGTVLESRRYSVPGTPFGTLLETSGHGAWVRDGKAYQVFFRFLLQNAETGAPIGTDNIRMWLTIPRGERRLIGTFQSQVKDLTDAVQLTVFGTVEGTPIAP